MRRTRGAAGRFGAPVIVDVPSLAGPGTVSVGEPGAAIAAWAGVRRSPIGSLPAGPHRLVLARASVLAAGTYTATATATAADGRRSGRFTVKFWVLRGPA